MGTPVLILGKSGSGKTSSLRNFNKNEIGMVNVLGKPLPFKNTFKTLDTDDYSKIKQVLLKSQTDTLVIDDAGYLITNQFMRGHGQGKGNAVFQLYNEMADNFWELIRFIQIQLPKNKIVYMLMHEDKNDIGDVKPKTIGKMLDEKVCVEGLFTIVLRSMKLENNYVFKTQTDGFDVTKTPMGLFKEEIIENDLKIVNETIKEYYNLEGEDKNEKDQ